MTTQAQGFEIESLDQETDQATFKVTVITDSEGAPLSGFIIVGKNSPQYQEAASALRVANIRRASQRKQRIDLTTEEGAKSFDANNRTTEHALALSVVTDWFGVNSEGTPLAFNPAIVEKMFTKYPQWRAMVVAALEVDANFMKA